MAPPKGFVDLAAAYNATPGTVMNVIGVIVDLMPPSTTRSGEYMFTLKLLDVPLSESVHGSQGMTLRYFAKQQHLLPRANLGDVLLLRQAKMQPFSGQVMMVSNYRTTTVVYPAASIPDPTFEIAYQGTDRLHALGAPADLERVSLEEQAYVIRLKADLSTTVALLPTPASTASDAGRKRGTTPPSNFGPPIKRVRQMGSAHFGRKFQLVQDLRHHVFADIFGLVVKIFPSQPGSCELYVTDYTANDALFYYRPPEEETDEQRDGDEFGYHQPTKRAWPGPYGYLVLKINAKDPHAHYINTTLNEGDFVLLRNVKMKIMAEGARLEGDMWPDHLNPDKVLVSKTANTNIPEALAILARRDAYWENRLGKKPQADKKPFNKTERGRQRKQRAKEKRAAATSAGADGHGRGSSRKTNDIGNLNKHIRCGHQETPLSTVKDVLDPNNLRHTHTAPDGRTFDLPFINANYRAKVRIIDFEPKRLEDFAVMALPDDEEEDEELSPIDAMELTPRVPQYEWFFSLVLEDASSSKTSTGPAEANQIEVTVHNQEAQHLFGNDVEGAQDLRKTPQLMAKLREKMCILWGNLEERREGEPLSNLPFECCISEYGIERDSNDPGVIKVARAPSDYMKLFRMHNTTIL